MTTQTINNNERVRKIKMINSSKLEREPKSSTAQTKSIDMSQMYISMN